MTTWKVRCKARDHEVDRHHHLQLQQEPNDKDQDSGSYGRDRDENDDRPRLPLKRRDGVAGLGGQRRYRANHGAVRDAHDNAKGGPPRCTGWS